MKRLTPLLTAAALYASILPGCTTPKKPEPVKIDRITIQVPYTTFRLSSDNKYILGTTEMQTKDITDEVLSGRLDRPGPNRLEDDL